MAGCDRPLQADCGGHSVGGAPAVADHGRFHRRLRETGQSALPGGNALCADGLRGYVALAVFQCVPDQLQRKPGGQCRLDFQSLLSPHHYPRRQRDRQRGGSVHLVQLVVADDALLQFFAAAADSMRPPPHPAGRTVGPGHRAAALRPERRLSGFPPYRPVHHPIRTLCFAGGFFQRYHPRKMADALCLQSHGRRHRRLPLGGLGQHSLSGFLAVPVRDNVRRPALDRHPLFPKHGKNLCRHHLGEGHERDHQSGRTGKKISHPARRPRTGAV